MITQARLQELLDYDQLTGVFTWKVRRGRSAPAGAIAGRVNKADSAHGGGYRYIGVDGVEYLAHRLAWLYVTGSHPTREIDHKNTTRDDNRFENLRAADDPQNCANRGKQANNTSGFKGVSFNKASGKFVASTQVCGVYRYLGLFATAELAHRAYQRAAESSFGEFARVS